MKRLAPFVIFALLLSACGGGLPPEAQSTATSAASALASHDKAAIAKLIVASQREGALGLDASYPIETELKKNELTLSDVLDLQFFTDITAAEVAEDGAALEDESNAKVMLTLDYGESTFVVKSFLLKKEGDAWLIDMKATLELWHRLDGADALSVLKMQK
ncbi:MAG: hypothetical protein KDB90_00860 [Planctomycetes bacterium]|nr:hypothetical protein [Planctomycetota bacterium]